MPNERSEDVRPETRELLLPPLAEELPVGARRLLEAAVEGFAERGYHGVSVRELAADAGMQAASVYAHFSSKEALLAELVLRGPRAARTGGRDAILGAGPDPIEQLREGVLANVRFHGTYPLLAVVANAELHALTDEHHREAIDARHGLAVLFTSVLERGNATGDFDCPDPWLALGAVGGMTIRLASWFRPAGQRDDASPLTTYPREAIGWFPEGDDDLEVIAQAYASFALRIVGARRD